MKQHTTRWEKGYWYRNYWRPPWMSEKAFARWLIKREVMDRMTGH